MCSLLPVAWLSFRLLSPLYSENTEMEEEISGIFFLCDSPAKGRLLHWRRVSTTPMRDNAIFGIVLQSKRGKRVFQRWKVKRHLTQHQQDVKTPNSFYYFQFSPALWQLDDQGRIVLHIPAIWETPRPELRLQTHQEKEHLSSTASREVSREHTKARCSSHVRKATEQFPDKWHWRLQQNGPGLHIKAVKSSDGDAVKGKGKHWGM